MKKLIILLLLAFSSTIASAQKLKILDQFKEDTAGLRTTKGLYLIPSRARFLTTSDKGINNGIASLDAGGKVPITQLPSSLLIYKGTWNPSTNSPSLSDASGTNGSVYICSTSGTRNLGSGSVTYASGDFVIHNGSVWQKSAGTAYVNSVNGQQGIVTLNSSHISEVTNLYFTNQRAIDAMTGNDISMRKLSITGTAGNGSINLVGQASAPSTPASGINLYSPSAGGIGYVNASGYTRTFSNPGAASNLTFTLPSSSGTLKTTNVANDSFTVAQTFPQGTAAATSINFGTPGTGIYGTSGSVNISAGGTIICNITGGGMGMSGVLGLNSGGTASLPALHFGTPSTGIYGNSSELRMTSGGTYTLLANATGVQTANTFTVNNGHLLASSGDIRVGQKAVIGTINIQNSVLALVGSGYSYAANYSTSGFGIRQDACTYTSTTSSGTIGTTGVNTFAIPTLAASSNTTLTNAATFYIAGAPIQQYTFTVTSANATAGATYTNNGATFTVVTTISGGTSLVCTTTGVPAASGTLTKASGTGDATIAFSSVVGVTIVNPYSLHVASGISFFGGNIIPGSNTVGSTSQTVFTGRTILLGGGTTTAQTFATVGGAGADGGSGAIIGLSLTSGITSSNSTQTITCLSVVPTINQTGTANGITRGIHINPTLTSATDFRALEVASGKVILPSNVPATSSSTGIQGEHAWDSNYIYICTGTNTWKRAAITTW